MIVDASVTLAWVLDDESSPYADQLLERVAREGAAVPAHWSLEVANGLLTAERHGRIDAAGIVGASRLLDRLPVEIVPIELTTATWSVLETAREYGLTAYDSAYLDLARFRSLPLATLDERLRAAATVRGLS